MMGPTQKSKSWGWVESFRGPQGGLDQVDNLWQHWAAEAGHQPHRCQWQQRKLPWKGGGLWEEGGPPRVSRGQGPTWTQTHKHPPPPLSQHTRPLLPAYGLLRPTRQRQTETQSTHPHCFWAQLINFLLLWICISSTTSRTWNLKCHSKKKKTWRVTVKCFLALVLCYNFSYRKCVRN